MKDRFTIKKYHYVTDFEASDYVLDDQEIYDGDLSVALDALSSDNWDSVDERESEVICYPADMHVRMSDGRVSHTDVVVKADKPENLQRLMKLYHARVTP